MTGSEVLALVRKHGGNARAAAREAGVARSTFQEWLKKALTGIGGPSVASANAVTTEVKVSVPTGGFSLEGAPVYAKRPTDVWGPRFNALRINIGYLPATLAQQWGCSVSTARDRARASGAIRYTEREGQYIEVITNPKTKGGK